jgi:signal transduction histidine kinase/CheY-like chemotaxis protein
MGDLPTRKAPLGLRESFARMLPRSGRGASRNSASHLVEALLELARNAGAGAPFDERMTALCRISAELLGCDRSSLFLLDGDAYRARFNHGNPPDIAALFDSHRVQRDDPLIARAVETRSYVVVNETLGSSLMNQTIARIARIRAIVVAPLFDSNRAPIGFQTAEYNQNPGRFSDLDATLLLGVANLAAIAAEAEQQRIAREAESHEREQLERRVRGLERLESIGLLAGGIAHDFNNLLTVILGNCEWLAGRVPPAFAEPLRSIAEAGQRGAALTHQLLAFGRRQILEPRVIDLARLVHGLEPMLRRLIPEDIDIEIHTDPNLDLLFADPVEIERVVVNLSMNARDAMPAGGRLTLEVSNAWLGAEEVRGHPEVLPGRYVLLTVTDTGRGFDPDVLERLFEPFATSKGPGGGSGLGLPTVYGVVRQSCGHISVYSEPGHGTSVKVYLPRQEGAAEPRAPEPVVKDPVERGDQTILLVDDDANVRGVERRVLEAHGYRVFEAGSREEAERVAKELGDRLDLLLSDVVLPGTTGPEVARALAGLRTGLRVLFVSGYTENAIVHHGVADPPVHVLSKPFTGDALARRVRAVLDAD